MTFVRTMTLTLVLTVQAGALWAAPMPRLSREAQEELAVFARKVLSGETTTVSPAQMLKMDAALRQPLPEQLFVTIFRDRAPGIRFTAQKLGLVECTFAAMGKARTLPSFEFYHYDDAKNVTLLFERVADRRTIPPERWVADLAFMNLGVDGLALYHNAYVGADAAGKPFTYGPRDGALPPGEVFLAGVETRDDFINRLCVALKVYYKLPRLTRPDMTVWNKAGTRVELLAFETFLSRGGAYPVVDLYRMNDLAAGPWADRPAAARTLADAIVRRQLGDGRFFTRYVTRTGHLSYLSGSVVDHAVACLALCDLAAASPEPRRARYLVAAARGIEHLKTFFRSQKTAAGEPFLFVVQNEEAKLGSAAAAVLALDRYASLTGAMFHDGDMKLLGKFLLTQQDDDGSFRHMFRYDAKAPFVYRLSHGFPGQAAWALAMLDKRFGGKEWGAAARKGADYLVTKREEEMHWGEAPADPWLAAALGELCTPFAEPRYADYARRMAEQAVKRQKIAGAPDLVGCFTGELEEGSVSAAALSARLIGETLSFTTPPPETRKAWAEAMGRAIGFIRLNELRPNNAFYLPNPEYAWGFVRSGTFDSDVRLDTTCYVIEALLAMARVEKMK